MHHRRRPLSIHATLALRHPPPTPTLLSPLRSIANTPLDDFQSNAWLDVPSTGLGITYLSPEDPALRMQVDGDEGLLSLPDDFPSPTLPKAPRRVHPGLDIDIDPTTSDIIGLIPDVNMYDKFRRYDSSGVNPLDTICSTSLHDFGLSYTEPASSTLTDRAMDSSLSATHSRPEQTPSPRVIRDIMSILVQPSPDFSFLPWSSANSPSHPTVPRPPTPIKLDPALVPDSEHQPVLAPCLFEHSNTTHPSPVFNAHLGIELGELISRAERFRTKYPERDIDRAWLSHFAGKLSDRGELLNNFRCYVIGCDQRNKRRDHILVHVGAHIGQRPFACSVCPLRFLRKNECKRHEASHSGFRPFSCDICGQSFVRQDLVKRHVKRTHELKDENVSRQPRKRARL